MHEATRDRISNERSMAYTLARLEWQRNKTGRKDISRAKLRLLKTEPDGWTSCKHVDAEWTDELAHMDPHDLEECFLAVVWANLIGSLGWDEKFPSHILGYTDNIAPRDGKQYRTITVYANGEPLPMLPEPAQQAA